MENNQNKILGIFANKTQLYIAIAAIAVVLVVAIIVICVSVGGNDNNVDGGNDNNNGIVDNNENDGNTEGNGNEDNTDNSGNEGNTEGDGNKDDDNNDDNNENTELAYKNAIELINKVWEKLPDSDDNGTPEEYDDFIKFTVDEEGNKSYYFTGGYIVTEDYELITVEGAAGEVALEAGNLDSHLGYPADKFDLVLEAASLTAMNQNVLTVGAVRLADGADIAEIAAAFEANIQARMWFCGIPEKVVIIEAPGNYIISIFGQSMVDSFVAEVLNTIEGAKVLIDNPIM